MSMSTVHGGAGGGGSGGLGGGDGLGGGNGRPLMVMTPRLSPKEASSFKPLRSVLARLA